MIAKPRYIADRALNGTSPTCPMCLANKGGVLDSRLLDGTIYRRRMCGTCGHRFSTKEYANDRPRRAQFSAHDLRKFIGYIDATTDRLDTLRSHLTDLVTQEEPSDE